eukprot:CAMPEP_0172590006 /NCGR_PEP_ID=MMETSP1068-20121228/8496_1 /TAXON_ID=35684 /ORGANISM="Pseudopedinella elastica, Strain CCMP716" /LENGTH=804 /DNA_ID=CAMNT_0013385687 /DNA_START=190 /DNA_END=2604 /DNA_ORIENTATION=-
MKYGQYLEENMTPEWVQHYMSYKELKKILKVLEEQMIAKPPSDGWTSGVSLSTPAPTNAAGMPTARDEDDASVDGLSIESGAKVYTENDFFKLLEADMEKVQAFTLTQVRLIRQSLRAVDESVTSYSSGGEVPVGVREQVDAVGDLFLKLEKFVNLNFTGFRKILKKHDKRLPTPPCSNFYIGRLHQQAWVRGDYSDVLLNISRLYSVLRGDAHKEAADAATQGFFRKTTKYWVRPEFVTAIKYVVSQRLPVFVFGADGKQRLSDAQLVNSVYLDNSALELYHGRLDKTPGAIALRLRWYGTGEPELVFVERKTHRDSWTGEVSVKERFIIKPKEVQLLLEGKFPKQEKMAEMRAKGKSEEEIADWDALVTEVTQAINSKQLVPTMRSQYMRTAFQIENDASVRISLDTNLCMIYERDSGVLLGDRWYRDPTKAVPVDEITRFPHAVLEVKLEIAEGASTPDWVKEILASGMVVEVFKFSKFIHGCAVLMQDDVQAVPYWVDDPSLNPSIEASHGSALLGASEGRIDANKAYPQLLPHGAMASQRRPALNQSDPGGGGGGGQAAATSKLMEGGRKDAEAQAALKRKLKAEKAKEKAQAAAGGGGGGGGLTSLEPLSANGSSQGGAQTDTDTDSLRGAGRDGSELTDLDDMEREAAMGYYEAQAALHPSGACTDNTQCWWLGAENLVADDLPTPTQKVEPKQHFANERTFVHWLHQAVYLTALGSGLLALAPRNSLAEFFAGLCLCGAFVLVTYAMRTFHRRASKIRHRLQVRWDDPFGPVVLGSTLALSFTVYFGFQLADLGVI